MRAVQTIIVTLSFATLTVAASYRAEVFAQSQTAQAEQHLRKACELVWAGSSSYKIDGCTKRAMAAMGDENRLRDNELKRMLIASERELETCTQALEGARRGHTDVAEVRAKPNPR